MSGVSSLFGKNKAKKSDADKAGKAEKKKKKSDALEEDDKWAEKTKKAVVIVNRAAATLVTEDTEAVEAAARQTEQDELDMKEKLEILDTKNMLEAVRQRKLEAEAAALEALEEEKRVKAEKEAGGVSVEPEATPGVYNAGARIAARMGQAPKPQESAEAFPDLATALKTPVVPPPAPAPAAAAPDRARPYGGAPFGGGGGGGYQSREREAPVDPAVSAIFGASTGERPRLKLAPRTIPVPEVVVTPEPTPALAVAEPVAVVAPTPAVEAAPAAAPAVEAPAEEAKPVEKKKKKKKAAFGEALDLDDLNI